MRQSSNKRFSIVAVLALMVSVFLVSPAVAEEGHAPDTGTHMKLSGVITKVQSGFIYVKTPWGQVTINAKGFKNAKVGQEVIMWVNENNVVIDMHKKGEAAPSHRLITGNLTYASPDKKEVKLWTPDGEKTFSVEKGRSKLSVIQEGAPVTVELNEAGEVIDVHQVQLDLRVDPNAQTKNGYHIKLSGVVTTIKSGIVFVKTPAGSVSVSSHSGLKDVKPGDEVSLWVNENNMVIDAHKKGEEGIHRFITGKLNYASPDKKEIKLWTPEGEKTFAVQHGKSKLSTMKEGSRITVEVNDAGNVIDVKKAG